MHESLTLAFERKDKILANVSTKASNTLQKIKIMEDRREDLYLKTSNDFKVKNEEFRKTMSKIKENKSKLNNFQQKKMKEIYLIQYEIISERAEKDKGIEMEKRNIVDNYIIQQFEVTKKNNEFLYEMNRLKDNSMSKLTYNQKKEIYLRLKREEAEKKKEEEDLLKRQQGR